METHKYTEAELAVKGARAFVLQLPRKTTYKEFRCKDCGKPVVWAISKKGNTYLASVMKWDSHEGSSSNGKSNQKYFYPFHECQPNAEYQGWYAEAMQLIEADRIAKLESGEVVKGAHVEVFKGKKIPVGTTGEVFWIADEANKYGQIMAGIKTADDEKIWVAVEHLKVIAK